METNKMQVATISFHRVINYGAIFQVYALQNTLEELGVECTVLDYRCEELEKIHTKKRISDCKTIKDYIRYFLLAKNQNKKFQKFRGFKEKYLNISKPLYTHKELESISEDFDQFICGSDQVWNSKITKFDTAYFLEFVKDRNKKNSYAASFGFKEIPTGQEKEYDNLLSGYNNMSIREKQGAKILSELLNVDTEIVLDPTLLVNKEKWLKIADKNMNHGKYILIYAFNTSGNLLDFAKNLSKKTGLKILFISSTYKVSTDITYIKAAGPEEFLGLFSNAEYIITNSFHGTAFSINFNKKFFTEFLPESMGVNSRLEDILELFGLQDRRIVNSDISNADKSIDYEKVNVILEKERDKSISFMKKIIE